MTSESFDADGNQVLRDLSWAVDSPSLLIDLGPDAVVESPLDMSSVNADQLLEFLQQQPTHLVGKYFERLIHFYLQQICGFEMIASGLQIQDNGRTIGELDFVFRDTVGQLQHWETAVKFFLCLPHEHSPGCELLGPNPADSFESKIRRLFKHQLPLSQHPFPEIDARKPFVKGRIFYHLDTDLDQLSDLPELLSENHLRGLWLRASELPCLRRLFGDTNTRCKILPKPFWLSNEISASADDAVSFVSETVAQLTRHFQNSTRPRLLSILQRQNEHWIEVERLFVVANAWLDV